MSTHAVIHIWFYQRRPDDTLNTHFAAIVFLYKQPRPDDNPAFSLLSRCSLDDAGPDALVGDALYEHLDGLLRGHFVFSGLSMRFRTQVYAQFVREVFYRGA